MTQMKLSAVCAIALLMAGCGHLPLPNAGKSLKGVMGHPLTGTKGKTADDQLRIDVAQARGQAAHLWAGN